MDFKKKKKTTEFIEKARRKTYSWKIKKLYVLFERRERVLDAFESKIFPIKIEGAGLLD